MGAVPNTAPGAAHTLIERIFRHIDEAGEVPIDELPKAFVGEGNRSAVDYALQGLLNSNRITRTLGVYKVAVSDTARAKALARKAALTEELLQIDQFLAMYDRLAKEGA